MRSPREIAFRLKQELANLRLWLSPPSLQSTPPPPKLPLQPLADPAETLYQADEILRHRFPIFGGVLDTGPEIRWRRDYEHHIETGTPYFRRIPYLDFQRAGDHKYIWELNRHQHLVVLAQAHNLTGNTDYLREAQFQVNNWLAENPPFRGINWTSALEIAFRSLSWVWLDALAGPSLPTDFRRVLINALYLHGCFLEHNLSIYFSPNTHLLGEAVALHTLGVLYPQFPRSARWRKLGNELVQQQIERQVRDDGSHFEQSTWHDLLSQTSAAYKNKLHRMADYLAVLRGTAGDIPLIGDDDGGRTLWGQGFRPAAGLLPGASRLFPQSGTAVISSGDIQIIIKAGGFGPSTAGHSHSDVLSFVCRHGPAWWLVDSGTYTYMDPVWRDRFRGSAAHNTIRINGQDQATPAGPYRLANPPAVQIHDWSSTADRDFLDAECRYSGFSHRRRFGFRKPDVLVVSDQIEGPPGEHLIEQFWHAASEEIFTRMTFSHPTQPVEAWHSEEFGSKHPAAARCAVCRGSLPVELTATISFG